MRYILLAIITFIAHFLQIGGSVVSVTEENAYTRVELSDSTTVETYEYAEDSVLVVMTVCAPQCSSCARIYNKEGEAIRTITPPFNSIFPLATIENGQLVWEDNDDWEY